MPAALLCAAALPSLAQERLTGSDLAGVDFPEASRAWDEDPEGAKAATLELAAGFAASQCGATEFHVWQSVNETPDDIRQKTDEAFVAAGWALETISRTDDGGRIHLASRGGDRLVMSWEPTAGAVGLLLCKVAGIDTGDVFAGADPEEPEAAGDAMVGEDDFAAADAGPGIAGDIGTPRPRPDEEDLAPPIEITPEVAALAQGVAAAAEAAGPDPADGDTAEPEIPALDAGAVPLAAPAVAEAAHPPKAEDRLPGAEAAAAAPQAIDREFTAALTPADAAVVTPPAQAIEPALAAIPDEAAQPPGEASEIGDIIAQSEADTLTDAASGSATVVASGAAWRAALLVLALGFVTSSIWLFRRRRPAGEFA
ncbi:MAG: hypothetical protein IT534_01195, partial [Bauldia sp.]|nr:hypothetical protein [Bauldia sp.]